MTDAGRLMPCPRAPARTDSISKCEIESTWLRPSRKYTAEDACPAGAWATVSSESCLQLQVALQQHELAHTHVRRRCVSQAADLKGDSLTKPGVYELII
jgi:hypothetical protein